jgi:hypothetical protein
MAIPILGALWEKIVDKGGSIISELVTDKDLAKRLEHEFRSQMEGNAAEFKKMELETETRIFEAQAKTIQAELHQNDQYTKRTRPSIARKSFYAGLAYALLTSLPELGVDLKYIVIMPWQFQWSVLMLLYSPALTYMGVRGAEKWKSGGAV